MRLPGICLKTEILEAIAYPSTEGRDPSSEDNGSIVARQ